MKEIDRYNPALERLYLVTDDYGCGEHGEIFKAYPFDEILMLISEYLNRLKAFAYAPFIPEYESRERRFQNRQPAHVLYNCVNSLTDLESLVLSTTVGVFTDLPNLLRRFGSKCKKITYLELSEISEDDGELLEAIRPFQNVTKLVLKFARLPTLTISAVPEFVSNVESLVEYLPLL